MIVALCFAVQTSIFERRVLRRYVGLKLIKLATQVK